MAKKAKKRQNKLQMKWIITLVIAVALVVVLGLLKNNIPQSPKTQSGYQTYQSPTYGFTIEHPSSWEIRNDTQVFENGDSIAFRKTGQTQKEQTELTDGAQVVVSKPFTINSELTTWVQENFNNQSEFSKTTINDRTYQKIYTCGLGCMTFYYTTINEKIYGVAVFADGSDKEKMVYENATIYMLKSLQFTNTHNGSLSEDEAVAKVKVLPEVVDYLKRVPNGLVAVNGEDDNGYMVQVYEAKDGHTATFNWYNIDKSTGSIEKQF